MLHFFAVADCLVHELLNVLYAGLELNLALSLQFFLITGFHKNLLHHLTNGSAAI